MIAAMPFVCSEVWAAHLYAQSPSRAVTLNFGSTLSTVPPRPPAETVTAGVIFSSCAGQRHQ